MSSGIPPHYQCLDCNRCFRTETSFRNHFNYASNTTCERVKPQTRLVYPERSSFVLPGDEHFIEGIHPSFLADAPSDEFEGADFDSSDDIDRVWDDDAALLPVELDPDFIKLAARLELGDDSHSDVSSSEEEDDEMSPTPSFDYDED